MQAIKESGGLSKLVAYITDVPPPEDEGDKKKAGGKEKGGKGGKSGKEGNQLSPLSFSLLVWVSL